MIINRARLSILQLIPLKQSDSIVSRTCSSKRQVEKVWLRHLEAWTNTDCRQLRVKDDNSVVTDTDRVKVLHETLLGKHGVKLLVSCHEF